MRGFAVIWADKIKTPFQGLIFIGFRYIHMGLKRAEPG
jgi:hypothetical protein